MKKLTTMTDFIIDRFNERNEDYDILVYNYANFLKQPLELWMFVPCNEDGNVLEEPLHIELYEGNTYDLDCEKYNQAKERCLFEGFSEKDAKMALFANENIEDLIEFNLILTKTAIKQIGL